MAVLSTDADPVIDGIPFRDPARPILKRDPRRAWKHFKLLVQDKEETSHVFEIFKSLPRKDFLEYARNFCLSEEGKELYRRERALAPILDDHDALRALGPGTVAAEYIHFMESQGLTAAGLNAEYEAFAKDYGKYDDMLEWFYSRSRETHDLLHVLTGYSRDALGEQCVLAFTYGQDRMPAHLLIAYAGIFEIRRVVRSSAPVFRAVREAQRHGTRCPNIAHMPIRELLAKPLEQARQELRIGEPTFYNRCHEIWRGIGRDPYSVLRPATA